MHLRLQLWWMSHLPLMPLPSGCTCCRCRRLTASFSTNRLVAAPLDLGFFRNHVNSHIAPI
ncbi:hypothetical protein A2U01_0075369 [Trifolium medium]|uniref:Secreted protein n=1 Tax=Trifolium medium TaxID=97028 RepID=A0A392SZ40_9FABA|nr:hypothetical protein [Trifolium medium]